MVSATDKLYSTTKYDDSMMFECDWKVESQISLSDPHNICDIFNIIYDTEISEIIYRHPKRAQWCTHRNFYKKIKEFLFNIIFYTNFVQKYKNLVKYYISYNIM